MLLIGYNRAAYNALNWKKKMLNQYRNVATNSNNQESLFIPTTKVDWRWADDLEQVFFADFLPFKTFFTTVHQDGFSMDAIITKLAVFPAQSFACV